MVTGRPAFAGATSAVVSAAILHDSPPLPRSLFGRAAGASRGHHPEGAREGSSTALSIGVGAARGLQAICAHVQRRCDADPSGGERSRELPPHAPPLTSGPPAAASSDVQIAVELVRRHRRGVALAAVALVAAAVGLVALLPETGSDADG